MLLSLKILINNGMAICTSSQICGCKPFTLAIEILFLKNKYRIRSVKC